MARTRDLDPDRGAGRAQQYKAGVMLTGPEADRRAENRAGARELDTMIEGSPGLTRQQKDRERAMPRETTGDLGDPRMRRTLPDVGEVRRPLSSRQRKARSVTKRGVQDRLPRTQYDAVRGVLTDRGAWTTTNNALADATGDVQMLTDKQRQQVQRIDRAIQAYERANDRGHVVYCNWEPPASVNRANIVGFLNNQLPPGTTVEFDRFTATAHTMHEVEVPESSGRPVPVFEIQTRRGLYLGRSDSVDDTRHLLPRGMSLTVAGQHTATYQRPDGTTGTRLVVQLIDTTP